MPHPKGDNKSYSKIFFFLNSFVGRQSKRAKTDPKFVDFKLDGKFSSQTKNFRHFSHFPPER